MEEIDRELIDDSYKNWLSELGVADFGIFHDVCKYLHYKIPKDGSHEMLLCGLNINDDKNFKKLHKDWFGLPDINWVVEKLFWVGFVIENKQSDDGYYTLDVNPEKLTYLVGLVGAEKSSRKSVSRNRNLQLEGNVLTIKLENGSTKQMAFESTEEKKNKQLEVLKMLVNCWKNNKSLPTEDIQAIFTPNNNTLIGSNANDIIGNLRKTFIKYNFDSIVTIVYDKNAHGYVLRVSF